MYRHSVGGVVVLIIILATVLMFGGDTSAGQFKRLNVSGLAVNAQISVHASPVNQGAAMEMDVYEYLSEVATYRCRITQNTTGRALNLRRVGVNGTVQASCTTPVNGVCDLPGVLHAGNLLFQCTVSTGNGLPVAAGAHYTFAVQRLP